jgi:tRNA U34 5-methylaminomethyl-2-thiouridine-forming methyltransferase MnmC
MANSSNIKTILGSLGSYTFIKTDDGTQTIFSHYFDESCHSSSGALEETLQNYVLGTEVPSRLQTSQMAQQIFTVLEVGFGTGIGYSATIDALKSRSISPKSLSFISTELDEKLALFALENLVQGQYLKGYEKVIESGLTYFKGITHDGQFMKVLIGDARETIPQWRAQGEKVNAIYQDPFSPNKNPSLWTVEWFEELRSVSDLDCILSTYSSTKGIWKSMLEAGWRVSEAKGFGNKKLSTRAYLNPKKDSSAQILKWCQDSPLRASRDPSCT